MAVFPLPRAPSRRAAGNKLESVFPSSLCAHVELGAFSCFGVMVTAADRAAATCLRRGAKVFLYPIVCMRKPPMAKGHRRLSICRSSPRTSTAALSAAVDARNSIGERQLSGGTNPEETYPSNANRSSGERGLGGEALLSEKRPLPQPFPFPHTASSGGGPGGGASGREAPPRSLSKNEYCSR